MSVFRLTVFGTPAAGGSKRAFPIKKGGVFTGSVAVTDANKNAAPWKQLIRQQAGELMAGRDLFRGVPLRASFTFYVRRPQGHYGARGNVKDSAPRFPIVKPDVLKFARAVEDALSGIVYQDDAQIVTECLLKRFGSPERVEIVLDVENDVREEQRVKGQERPLDAARVIVNYAETAPVVRQEDLLPI